VVDAAAGRLEAAVDGEPDVLETPLEFRVEPYALRVLVPEAQSG
jgi:diacylglycerol kinase family enzyme